VSVSPPDIDGRLLKLRTSHGLFGERDLNAIYTALLTERMSCRLGVTGPARICEIGAGTGRVAYWSMRFGAKSYTIIDLPQVNVLQGYYLLKGLGADRVALYDEAWTHSAERMVRILPAHATWERRGDEYDIVLNQDSFPEMDSDTVEDYLRWIGATSARGLLSINHESKPTYGPALVQVSVPEVIEHLGGFELLDRYPYWLRKGYVVELYRAERDHARTVG